MRENGPVIYEKINTEKGSIAKIMLNRPDHGNRIDGEMWHDFMEAVDLASADREVRVVIFGGIGEDFCCGFDTGDPSVSLNANEDGVITVSYTHLDVYKRQIPAFKRPPMVEPKQQSEAVLPEKGVTPNAVEE